MSSDKRDFRLDRRTTLRTLGAGALGGALLTGTAAAQGSKYEIRYGEGVDVTGDGEIDLQTNAQVCTTGGPIYVGIGMSEAAFETITSNEAEGGHEHPEGGVSYNLDFPEFEGSPFTFAGIDWGPHGHPPAPWQFPHFDIHYYVEDEEVISGIEGGVAQYEIPDERMPEGYVTAEALGAPREIVPGMGEHLVDPATPELGGAQFTHTLIWGAYDVDGDGQGDQIFIEPMVTSEFIANLDGRMVAPVALPEEVTKAGYYPTQYEILHSEETDTYQFRLQQFEWRDA